MEKTHPIASAIIVASIMIVMICTFVLLFVLLFIRKKQRLMQQNIMMQEEFQQALLQSQIEIHEQTLNSISGEIHDNICQELVLANINIHSLPVLAPADLEKKEQIRKIISKTILELRDISRSLNTVVMTEMGLVDAVKNELKLVKNAALETSLHIVNDVATISPQNELILFRVIQECLNNIIKHAKASQVAFVFHYHSTYLEIIIKDNGVGFDVNTVTKGQGLHNIENRINILKATHSIDSQPLVGTTITIHFPLN